MSWERFDGPQAMTSEKGAGEHSIRTLSLFTPKAPLWQAFIALDKPETRIPDWDTQPAEALIFWPAECRVARASVRRRRELVPQRSMAASAKPGTNAARRSSPEICKRELNFLEYSARYWFVSSSNKPPDRSM